MFTRFEIYILMLVRKYHHHKYLSCLRQVTKSINEERYVGALQWRREANRHLEIGNVIASRYLGIAL